jgi:hypothetical protein
VIDTINISVESPVSDINLLNGLKQEIDQFGLISYTGYLDCMWVKSFENRTIIIGNLAKYVMGNNIETLSYTDLMGGIDMLGAELGIPIWDGKIIRIDIGTTLPVIDPVKSYLAHLADYPRMKRMSLANSLYFGEKPLAIVFYDKLKEMRSKNHQIPPEFINGNWMRIETRFHSGFLRKWAESNSDGSRRVSDILSPTIYKKLVNEWHKQINVISWDNLITTKEGRINNVKDFGHYLLCKGIESIGGMSKFCELLDQLKYTSKSFGSSQRSRYKKDIKQLLITFQPSYEESFTQKEFYSLVDLARSIVINDIPKV